MNVSCVYTLNELQKICPSLRLEHFKSEEIHIKKLVADFMWQLGCIVPNKLEIVEGLESLNRLQEVDTSPRITFFERQDDNWLKTRFASHQVKILSKDVGMMKELDSISNQRSFNVESGE